MINKGYRLALAKMLKLYKEISTTEAVLVAEADEIEVGTEVYVESEEGMVPAPDGEYNDTVENKIYVVAGGTITEIREKESTMETGSGNGEEGNTEENTENMEENSDNGEDANNSADGSDTSAEGQDENKDNEMEALKEENEALKAKVAELEATVSDLEDQIAAYKAKEEETEAPAAEDAEKFAKQSTGDAKLDKKLAAARRILNAVK